jgi:PAS domain S-box-containing protein
MPDQVPPSRSSEEVEGLLAEPHLHQAELEMRNEAVRRTQVELEGSREPYRGLLASIDNVVALLDDEGRALYANDAAALHVDSDPQDLIVENLVDLFPAEMVASGTEQIKAVFREDRASFTETQATVHGRPRWYLMSLQPIHDDTGKVTQVLINATDIHDIKRTEQELQELTRTLKVRIRQRSAEAQDLYDHAPCGYHSLDGDGNVIMVNQTELDWLG